MTSLSPQARAERLLRVFQRSGGDGTLTRQFSALPLDTQTHLRAVAEIRPTEVPILACYRDERQWTLLTSERLLSRAATKKTTLDWQDIEDATIDEHQARIAVGRSPEGKLSLSRLRVLRQRGEELVLELEPGPSFIGFWNVLKTVANLGKRRPSSPY